MENAEKLLLILLAVVLLIATLPFIASIFGFTFLSGKEIFFVFFAFDLLVGTLISKAIVKYEHKKEHDKKPYRRKR